MVGGGRWWQFSDYFSLSLSLSLSLSSQGSGTGDVKYHLGTSYVRDTNAGL